MKVNEILKLLNIPAQHATGITGRGVKVALIDEAVDYSRVPGVISVNYDPAKEGHWHATTGAYIISNAAPGAEIYCLRKRGEWTFARCLDWCVDNGIDIVNMSFNTIDTAAARDAIKRAHGAGIKLVAAAGNAGYDPDDKDSEVGFPANAPGVIAVANMSDDKRIAGDSSGGPEVFVAAPGVIDLPWPPHSASGTSFAAYWITVCLALFLQVYPDATTDDCRQFLHDGTVDLPPAGKDERSGWGYFVFPDPEQWIGKKEEAPVVSSPEKEGEVMVSADKLNIIEHTYDWASQPTKRTVKVNFIILHHAAMSQCSPADIHRAHLKNGWVGIGYHYFVSKAGVVYRGRQWDTVGAHCTGFNANSVGVCAEGNFETDTMPPAQKQALILLCRELRTLYPDALVVGHGDLVPTACPGVNYPLHEIQKESFIGGAPATEKVIIKVGGQSLEGSKEADGPAMGPVRAIAEALGAVVDWDEMSKTVTITPPAEHYKQFEENQRLKQVIKHVHGILADVVYG